MNYIEFVLGKAVYSLRGRDAGLFTKLPQFKDLTPSITVTSTVADQLPAEYVYYGPRPPTLFPPISWTNPEGTQEVVVIIQDVDVPIPSPITHAIYYNISPDITTLPSEFFTIPNPTYAEHGIRVGKNGNGSIYWAPRPLYGHGAHRYFFQVIALNRKLESVIPDTKATYSQMAKAIKKEDIIGWGQWIATAQRMMSTK
ncbi:PEBP-like protein [Clavulina sp. PMI_390]|nr:PEBP-like protein [Clavulina sp. PMI_390]